MLTPTYTGLGERAHLASPSIDLDTHIQDIVGVLDMEDLRDVVLVGHSYGGMVATGVADRARDRIAQLVYLDAFVPQDGQSAFDLQAPETRKPTAGAGADRRRGLAHPAEPAAARHARSRRGLGGGPPVAAAAQDIRAAVAPHGESAPPPRSYIYCRRARPDDGFRQFAERAQRESGWRHYEIDASHNPHITAPQALLALLEEIVAARS